jgi:hypothetical protein
MITKQDLLEAIAECQGERNPDARTCMKLAAFYTILDHFDSEDEVIKPTVNYSYSPPVASNVASYTSGTEFSQAIDGKDINKVLATADEAFDAVRTFAPQIYDVIIEKFFEIS